MTARIKKLVKMAEQITANLAYSDDQEIISTKVADHLNRFWDPRMKEAIASYAAEENSELTEPLRLAICRLTLPSQH